MAKKLKHEEEKEKTWKEMGCFDRFFVVIDFPFVWFRKLTIPPCEEDDFDNWLVMAWPILGIPIAVMVILKKFPKANQASLLYFIPIIIWAAIWYKNNKERFTPPEKGYIWISFVGMVCGFI